MKKIFTISLLLICILSFAGTKYWVGGGSSNAWSATAPTNWATTSGGTNNAVAPTTSDDVFFNGVGTHALDPCNLTTTVTIVSIDFTGYSNAFQHTAGSTLTLNGTNSVFKISSSMTYTINSATTSIIAFSTASGTVTLTSTGHILGTITKTGAGELDLADGLTLPALGSFTLTQGTFQTNSNDVGVGLFASSNTNTRTINLGSSTINCSGVGSVWNTATTTNLAFSAQSSRIIISDNSSTAKTFAGGSEIFGMVTFSGDNITITGSNTFTAFTLSNAGMTTGLKVTSGTTQTMTSMSSNGSSGNLCKVQAVTAASAFTFSTTANYIICVDFVQFKDITASSGSGRSYYAGTNSTSTSGNSVWSFTGCRKSGFFMHNH